MRSSRSKRPNKWQLPVTLFLRSRLPQARIKAASQLLRSFRPADPSLPRSVRSRDGSSAARARCRVLRSALLRAAAGPEQARPAGSGSCCGSRAASGLQGQRPGRARLSPGQRRLLSKAPCRLRRRAGDLLERSCNAQIQSPRQRPPGAQRPSRCPAAFLGTMPKGPGSLLPPAGTSTLQGPVRQSRVNPGWRLLQTGITTSLPKFLCAQGCAGQEEPTTCEKLLHIHSSLSSRGCAHIAERCACEFSASLVSISKVSATSQ